MSDKKNQYFINQLMRLKTLIINKLGTEPFTVIGNVRDLDTTLQ